MKLIIEKAEYINKTFRINKKLLEPMKKICTEKSISLNKFVEICIRYALANFERDGADELPKSEVNEKPK